VAKIGKQIGERRGKKSDVREQLKGGDLLISEEEVGGGQRRMDPAAWEHWKCERGQGGRGFLPGNGSQTTEELSRGLRENTK